MAGELPLVDRLVDAVLLGSSKASKLALEYFHKTWDARGFFCDAEIDSGGFVPWNDLRTRFDDADFEGLEPMVTAERYAAILAGARLSADEKRQALQAQLASYFAEPVEGWMYQLLAVDDSAGRRVVASAISEGSSFEGVRMVFMGVYLSQADAVAALKHYGLIDAKDLNEALPGKRRLSRAQLKSRTRETTC